MNHPTHFTYPFQQQASQEPSRTNIQHYQHHPALNTEPARNSIDNYQRASVNTNASSNISSRQSKRKYEKIDYFNAGNTTKNTFQAELRSQLSHINKSLQLRGLKFSNLTIIERPIQSNQYQVGVKIRKLTQESNKDGHNVFLNKDEGRLSDEMYHKFRKTIPSMPSLYHARKFRKQMALMFPVNKTEFGVYNNLQNKIEKMIDLHWKQLQLDSNTLKIKLSADGAQIGRKAKLLNLTFSFLQQYLNNSSFIDGNFTLGIFDNIKEDYESVKVCFSQPFEELSKIKTVSFSEKTFQIEYFFAGDEKMLALLLGFNAANAKYPCIYCKCPSDKFFDTSKHWSVIDETKGARTNLSACKTIGKEGQIMNH